MSTMQQSAPADALQKKKLTAAPAAAAQHCPLSPRSNKVQRGRGGGPSSNNALTQQLNAPPGQRRPRLPPAIAVKYRGGDA